VIKFHFLYSCHFFFSLFRLSERNCIEVVSLLLEKGLLELVFTTDGKEYLTHEQLRKEIEDELFLNGGRINLVEASKILNVDLQKIQPIAEQIAQDDQKITLILGQLVSSDYIIRIAAEINERLNTYGEINIADITGTYDLPSDFLLSEVVEKNLNRIIFGKQDSSNPRLFYTPAFISRCKAKIRGALVGITKPTPVSAILSQTGIQERIFFSLTNDISSTGSLTSRSTAGIYIPHIFIKTQAEWVKNFFKQNGYVEYESVSALGVADPKSFISKQLPQEKLSFLQRCVVGKRIIDQVESTLEESIETSTFLDISTILPSVIGEEDIEMLIQIVLTPSKQRLTQIFNNLIVTTKYIDVLLKPVYEIAEANAKASVESGAYQKFIADKILKHKDSVDVEEPAGKGDKREERRKKAAGGKQGGGAQGRETKTKSTKKHQRGGRNKDNDESDSDEEVHQASSKKRPGKDVQLNLVAVHDIKKSIKVTLENDGLEDLAAEIANYYLQQINKYAESKAHELYGISLQNSMQNRKQNHSSLQDKLNNLLNDIRLYEKGLKMFSKIDTQTQLTKYLLKSLGTDFANEIAFYIAAESDLNFLSSLSVNTITAEQRTRIANESDAGYKQALTALNKSINCTIEEFLTAAENMLAPCSMIVKKIDKKKDKYVKL
jgi:E3 UFM1-protein ligase 1